MTDKISSLSKYEDVKKSYLQVGKKFRIPLDIIKYIFNIVTKEEKKEGKKQMIYLKNILLFRLIASPFDIEFHIFGGKKYSLIKNSGELSKKIIPFIRGQLSQGLPLIGHIVIDKSVNR